MFSVFLDEVFAGAARVWALAIAPVQWLRSLGSPRLGFGLASLLLVLSMGSTLEPASLGSHHGDVSQPARSVAATVSQGGSSKRPSPNHPNPNHPHPNHQNIARYLQQYSRPPSLLTHHLTTGQLFSASVLNQQVAAPAVKPERLASKR
ncbi:MAG: hypothetical protein AAFR15_05560 [Cyanobacteria bacterium J06627_15]